MEEGSSEIRIKLSRNFKKDLDALAKAKGTSTGVLAKKILKLYVREEYYKKAREILNFEDRVGTAVLLELKPQLEQLKKLIYDLSSKESETEKKGEGNVIYKREEKKEDAEVNKNSPEVFRDERIDEEKEKLKEKYLGWNFPVIAGLDYKIEDGFVYYDDGSIWSLRLGAWIGRGPKVIALKRKRDKELGI